MILTEEQAKQESKKDSASVGIYLHDNLSEIPTSSPNTEDLTSIAEVNLPKIKVQWHSWEELMSE